MHRIPTATLTVLALGVLLVTGCPPSSSCLDFEDLSSGSTFPNGSSFTTAGRQIDVRDFEWSNGNSSSTGRIETTQQPYPAGSGKNLRFNNANGDFHVGPAARIELRFADLGGNSNLRINGEFRNVGRLVDADGSTLGGVQVAVNANQSGNNWIGTMALDGFVSQFAIGGQELWIDDLCGETKGNCIRFEDVPAGSSFGPGDVFNSDGRDIVLEQFQWSNGNWTPGIHARIDPPTHSGGTGQDVNSNNVNLAFDLPYPVSTVHLKFGEYGGNVNLRVNGEHRNVANLQDLHGQTVGGVAVEVHVTPAGANVLGLVVLRGEIDDLAVGGQELWIDDVCYLE